MSSGRAEMRQYIGSIYLPLTRLVNAGVVGEDDHCKSFPQHGAIGVARQRVQIRDVWTFLLDLFHRVQHLIVVMILQFHGSACRLDKQYGQQTTDNGAGTHLAS